MLCYSTALYLKLGKFLGKPEWLSEKSIHDITNFNNRLNIGRCLDKKHLVVTLSSVEFSKVFESIHRGKMEQIILAYGLPKETVAIIMMLYKNTKVKVCSPDGNTDFFAIVIDVLKKDTLSPYLFIIC